VRGAGPGTSRRTRAGRTPCAHARCRGSATGEQRPRDRVHATVRGRHRMPPCRQSAPRSTSPPSASGVKTCGRRVRSSPFL
jgi:hypothetical protein